MAYVQSVRFILAIKDKDTGAVVPFDAADDCITEHRDGSVSVRIREWPVFLEEVDSDDP